MAQATRPAGFYRHNDGRHETLVCDGVSLAAIAEAFSAVRYPILPKVKLAPSRQAREHILEIRHSSLYCPRDFDISPYFNVVKPTITQGFDYKRLNWADRPLPLGVTDAPLAPEFAAAGEDTEILPA